MRAWKARAAIAVVVAAAAINIGWSVANEHLLSGIARGGLGESLKTSFRQIARLPAGVYSQFGWLDAKLPAHLWVVGVAAAGLIVATAFVRMSPRQRLSLLVVVVGVGAVTLAVTLVQAADSYEMQARYVLAVVAPLPILAVSASAASESRWIPRRRSRARCSAPTGSPCSSTPGGTRSGARGR